MWAVPGAARVSSRRNGIYLIRTNSAVSRILIENGRVRGVAVDQGQRRVPTELLDTQTIEAPIVVSAVAIATA